MWWGWDNLRATNKKILYFQECRGDDLFAYQKQVDMILALLVNNTHLKSGKKAEEKPVFMKVEEKRMTNPQMQSEQAFVNGQALETEATEGEALALLGFTEDEIISLLWLRQWYQHGGSDRVEIVRHLETLKQQVLENLFDR